MQRELLPLVSGHEQDVAACEDWLRKSNNEDRMRVWAAINADLDDDEDHVKEIVLRFAQLGFTEMYLRMMENPS
jgi:hypothetical protein